MGGQPTHPDWYLNLVADPHVTLQDGATVIDLCARTAAPEERATWWPRATEVWPDYDAYQARTDRQIPPSCCSTPSDRTRRTKERMGYELRSAAFNPLRHSPGGSVTAWRRRRRAQGSVLQAGNHRLLHADRPRQLGLGAPHELTAAFLGSASEVTGDTDLGEQLVLTNGTRTWEPGDLETANSTARTDPAWLRIRAAMNNAIAQER
jgi:hypothetical protein